MKRKLLFENNLGTLVKLTPNGKTYKVVMSDKSKFKAALEDSTGKVIEKSQLLSVYVK